jgi:hypothetical protein
VPAKILFASLCDLCDFARNPFFAQDKPFSRKGAKPRSERKVGSGRLSFVPQIISITTTLCQFLLCVLKTFGQSLYASLFSGTPFNRITHTNRIHSIQGENP